MSVLAVAIVPQMALAARATISVEPTVVGAGDLVNVTLSIDSDTPVNAFSGSLRYPSELLVPDAVSDGGSIVSVWLTRPEVEADTAISFVGLTPGGYRGEKGKVFSVTFRAAQQGSAVLSLTDVAVLRNDGSGTSEATEITPLQLSIGPVPMGGYTPLPDTTAPESFVVYLSESANTLGTYDAVFSAVDKDSGIDYYEVAEKRPLLFWKSLVWSPTESPYLVSDQSLTSDVYVRAVDQKGNMRTSVLRHSRLFTQAESLILLGILGAGLLVWFFHTKRRYFSV